MRGGVKEGRLQSPDFVIKCERWRSGRRQGGSKIDSFLGTLCQR